MVVDEALKASMVYWRLNKLNQYADNGDSQASIDKIGKIVNGSGEGLPNGYLERRSYTKLAFENLK